MRSGLGGRPAVMLAVRLRDGDNCRFCRERVNWADRKSKKAPMFHHRNKSGWGPDAFVVAHWQCATYPFRGSPFSRPARPWVSLASLRRLCQLAQQVAASTVSTDGTESGSVVEDASRAEVVPGLGDGDVHRVVQVKDDCPAADQGQHNERVVLTVLEVPLNGSPALFARAEELPKRGYVAPHIRRVKPVSDQRPDHGCVFVDVVVRAGISNSATHEMSFRDGGADASSSSPRVVTVEANAGAAATSDCRCASPHTRAEVSA